MRGELKQRMDLLAQENEKRKKLATLRKDTLRKAEFLKRKAVIDPHEVYGLIKGFFREFLDRHEEFTVGELREELKRIYISNTTRQEIGLILDKLHRIEYLDVQYTHAELVALLETFAQSIHQLVKTRTKKVSFLTRLRTFLFKEEPEPDVVIAELPVVEAGDPAQVRLLTLVERCYEALDKHRLGRAKACYKALLDEYGKLTPEQRKKHYPLIDQTYRDILNRHG